MASSNHGLQPGVWLELGLGASEGICRGAPGRSASGAQKGKRNHGLQPVGKLGPALRWGPSRQVTLSAEPSRVGLLRKTRKAESARALLPPSPREAMLRVQTEEQVCKDPHRGSTGPARPGRRQKEAEHHGGMGPPMQAGPKAGRQGPSSSPSNARGPAPVSLREKATVGGGRVLEGHCH